jgi:hypothetical protein
MHQLKENILEVFNALKEAEDFITHKTGEDPIHRTTTWIVDYQPNLKSLYSDIDNVVRKLEKVQQRVQSNESEILLKIGKSLRNRFARLLKKYSDLKEQSLTTQGEATFTPGEGAQYATPKSFKKNHNYKPKFKKLYEGEINDFQQERIDTFTQIEKEINDLSPLISNAKNATIEYYNNNPGSYAIVRSTDLILDYIKDIKQLLKGEEE